MHGVAFFDVACFDVGVPVVEPAGGHAVFVDAASLPGVTLENHPGQALCNAVYTATTVRGALNFLSPDHERANAQIVRFAVPVGRYADAELDALVQAFRTVLEHKAGVRGLARIGMPAGAMGKFVAAFRPL